jgi:hypothetical protein
VGYVRQRAMIKHNKTSHDTIKKVESKLNRLTH